jgi:hypothetical protein
MTIESQKLIEEAKKLGYKLAQLAHSQAESLQESLQVPLTEQGLVYRLRKRAEIRRQIPGRRSVEQGETDRIADLLDEAADEIERLTALENK